ncbi:hypothetical protein TNIN_451241 [Trichonephila inaurata madagascariensis]|uniref:Uncharacterized protein n=1 Tax=Trichonephila inaurata madagascariensis TaxID=2747483 RepID=A0A8X6WN41_9ARAC|nr:hypothetical protein TNIN_451241 [Trichonephila inaurata madagascariensis]
MTISASTSIGYQCSIRLSLLSLLSKRGYGPLAFPEVPCSSLHFDLGFVLVGFSHIGWRGLPRVSKSFAKLSVLFLFRKPLAFEAMFHVENPPPPNEDFDYLSLPEKPEYFLWTTPNIPRGDQMKINYNLISKSFYFEKLKSSDEKDQEIKNSDETTKKKYEKTAQKIRSDVMNTKAVTDVISQLINYIEKSEEAEKKDLCPDEEGHHSRRSEKEMDYLSDEGRRRSLSI